METYALQHHDMDYLTKENLGLFDSEESAYQSIVAWWNLNDFEPKYIRTNNHDESITIDYGSHRMYYVIKKVNNNNYMEAMFGKPQDKALDVINIKIKKSMINKALIDLYLGSLLANRVITKYGYDSMKMVNPSVWHNQFKELKQEDSDEVSMYDIFESVYDAVTETEIFKQSRSLAEMLSDKVNK